MLAQACAGDNCSNMAGVLRPPATHLMGGTLDGYCSDITRTVFTGKPPEEFRELYAVADAGWFKRRLAPPTPTTSPCCASTTTG